MKFKTLLNWCMVASIFMDDFIILRLVLPFDFYVYYIFFIVSIAYYIFSQKSFRMIPRWFFFSILILIGVTCLVTFANNTFDFKVIKQIIGISFTSIAYYTFISYNDNNLGKIFRMYIVVSLIVAGYGVLEEFLHLGGIHLGKNLRRTTFGLYRVYSVMGEPYFLAVVLIPGLFLLWSNFTRPKGIKGLSKEFVNLAIIGSCFIFTFSTAGFIGFTLIFIFWLYNKKYLSLTSWKIIFLPLIVLGLTTAFSSVQDSWEEFNIKSTETFTAFTDKSISKEDIRGLNSSSFAIFSNYVVAKASFEERPLTGSGLGTHEKNYMTKFGNFFDKDLLLQYGAFNANDANSLFLRLMSETGLLGLGLFFTFLIKNFVGRRGYEFSEIRNYTIINQGIFIWFIVRLVRTGNYFGNGFFLFFFIYYYSAKIVRLKLKERKLRLENQANPKVVTLVS